MTANAEDNAHLVAMTRTGLATHMLRILPDGETGSGLSGDADEGAVLDLIADHLDTPVFRLGHGRYALEARAEQVDALMRAMPGLCPEAEFTVQEFAPPGEKPSDTQARVISRIECATEAIQAVLSRLDGPAVAEAAPQIAVLPVAEQLLDLLAERDAALLSALEARIAAQQPVIPDGALTDTVREALHAALQQLPPPDAPEADSAALNGLGAAIEALDARLAGLSDHALQPDLQGLLDERLARMEETLRAHLDARLDGIGEVKATVADTVSAATGGITRWLQDIDRKLAAGPAPAGAELTERLAGMLERQQVQIAALIDARLAAQAQKSDPSRLADMLQDLRMATQTGADRLDEIGRRLAGGQEAMILLDDRIGEIAAALHDTRAEPGATVETIGAVLDARLEAQSARLVSSITARLGQQPLHPEIQAALADLGDRLDRVEPMLSTAAELHDKSDERRRETLTAEIDTMVKSAAQTLAGHLVGAEDLLQARLEAQHGRLSAQLQRQLSDFAERIGAQAGTTHLPVAPPEVLAKVLAETVRAAQAAETARIAGALDALTENVRALKAAQETPDDGDGTGLATRLEALEAVLEAGFTQLAGMEDRLRPDPGAAPLAAVEARLADLAVELGALRDSGTMRIADAEQAVLGRIDDAHRALTRRLDEARQAAAPAMPAAGPVAVAAVTRLSVAMEAMLRRLDSQISRLEDSPAPVPGTPGLEELAHAIAEIGSRLDRSLGALGTDLPARLSQVLAGLTRVPQHPVRDGHGVPQISVALQHMLRRLDAQVARFEAAAPPAALPATVDIAAQLRETEARLVSRIEHIAPGEVDADALRNLSERLDRAIDRATPGAEGLTRLSSALQTILRRLDRQVSELESRGNQGGEIVHDMKMVLAEYLAQMDRRLAAAGALPRSA